MRRALAATAVLLASAAVALVAAGAGGDEPQRYRVVLDNAFGLIEGADFKVAGVRAGKIEKLDVQRSSNRALVTVVVERDGYGDFRTDVFCTTRPQSLIGEYFLECEPGRTGRRLPPGSTIPVGRTATTVPVDLVNNILRQPWRERLRLILNELGAGFASRGDDLNATIRRAVPALRETNRVLAILADNRRVLTSLTRDADRVLAGLAANKEDVGRFVTEARDAAEISASRQDALAETFRRFPTFLRELRPTLAELDNVAERQTPALRDLSAGAGNLTTFFSRLGPFSSAARPAVRSLGRASVQGEAAVTEAASTVQELRRLAGPTPDVAKNLRFVLEHLDDRRNAVEKDPDSPGGEGYTGLEALLQYPFDQSLAINIFDQRGYLLKLNALINECTSYTDAEAAKANPERTARCAAALGPNQPGINQPDPSTDAARASGPGRAVTRASRRARGGGPGTNGERADPTSEDQPARRTPLDDLLDDLPVEPPDRVSAPDVDVLLDYLFGP